MIAIRYLHERHRFRGMVLGRWVRLEIFGCYFEYATGRKYTGKPQHRTFQIGKLKR